MVVCPSIDGKPCRCELDDPIIHNQIQNFTRLVMKLLLSTISNHERLELRTLVCNRMFRTYLSFYVEELDKLH